MLIKKFAILTLMLALSGCGIKEAATSRPGRNSAKDINKASEAEKGSFEITGKITFKEIEGGFYAIEGNDGKKYDPINLPEDFRREGLSVRIVAEKKTGVMTARMYGTVIELLEISKL
jgi:predicted small lipoprotein YifL